MSETSSHAPHVSRQGRDQMAKSFEQFVSELHEHVTRLKSSIDRRNVPLDIMSDDILHDAAQVFEEATDHIKKVFDEWSYREFDGLPPKDQYAEFRLRKADIL